jgi:hypothetical protein
MTTNSKEYRDRWHASNPGYRCWAMMKQRCLNPNYPDYFSYGGRGITIYPEWIDNYFAFYDYIGPRPSLNHTIDRIDVDGNYEPGNVRWATKSEQQRNKRTIPIPEDTLQLILAYRDDGISYKSIARRLNKQGIPSATGRLWYNKTVKVAEMRGRVRPSDTVPGNSRSV